MQAQGGKHIQEKLGYYSHPLEVIQRMPLCLSQCTKNKKIVDFFLKTPQLISELIENSVGSNPNSITNFKQLRI